MHPLLAAGVANALFNDRVAPPPSSSSRQTRRGDLRAARPQSRRGARR